MVATIHELKRNFKMNLALARIEALDLPDDHPVFRAAAAASDDPRQARIPADLLIELAVGLDADVARRLVRQQSRGSQRQSGPPLLTGW